MPRTINTESPPLSIRIIGRLVQAWLILFVVMFIGYMIMSFFGLNNTQVPGPMENYPPIPFLEGPDVVTTTTICTEDMACWDCETMGNLICGSAWVSSG